MRTLALLCALLATAAAAQHSTFVGDYRLAEGPDVGGGLRVGADGRFQYFLVAGALDERAEGRWETRGNRICLTTDPKPVPPVMEKAPPLPIDGVVPTLLVTWPNGRGVAGVDFRIGFDSGDTIEGYTQSDGWTMPADDRRVPRWIDLREPVYGVSAPRFMLDETDDGRLRAIIVPNDMGVVDFDGACAEPADRGLTLHRPEGTMRFVRVDE